MTIKTSRFGEIEIEDSAILHMPSGMLGFEHCKRYVLLEDFPEAIFRWLQCVDQPWLSFIVINPMEFFPDYDIVLEDDNVEDIDLRCAADCSIFTTVTIDEFQHELTTDLVGPIIMNNKNMMAKQFVLQDTKYSTKQMIYRQSAAETAETRAVVA